MSRYSFRHSHFSRAVLVVGSLLISASSAAVSPAAAEQKPAKKDAVKSAGTAPAKPAEGAGKQDPSKKELEAQLIEKLTPLLDRVVNAYNEDNVSAFFGEFALSARTAGDEPSYEVLYKGMYKRNFGKILDKTPRLEDSNFDPVTPELVFTAATDNDRDARLRIQFRQENGEYKVSRFQITKSSL